MDGEMEKKKHKNLFIREAKKKRKKKQKNNKR